MAAHCSCINSSASSGVKTNVSATQRWLSSKSKENDEIVSMWDDVHKCIVSMFCKKSIDRNQTI